MPWKETDVRTERLEFVVRARQPGAEVAAICRAFGISRKTGYKWLRRAREEGLVDLAEHSRRPHQSPGRTPEAHEAAVVRLRRRYGWGSKKLQLLLAREGIQLGHATIERILKRQGLIEGKSRQLPATQRFERPQPNDLWQLDFKGEYRVQAGRWCYPLSLIDDHSRYLVALEPLANTRLSGVEAVLVSSFQHYGLPEAMLMDHGAPWWSTANGHGLTRLSVGLLEQDIRLIYSARGHPQTQGKVERFHRTLDEALAHRGYPTTMEGFQVALPAIRQDYNHDRPHESLAMHVPAARYHPSPRPYCPDVQPWVYPSGGDLFELNSAGNLRYQGRQYFVCEALVGKTVWSRRVEDKLLVAYRSMYIREIDLLAHRTRALIEHLPA